MNQKESTEVSAVQSIGRRKIIKTLVGGGATIAAYNLLPAQWGTPYIESVFLPAHAATSGGSAVVGTWLMTSIAGQSEGYATSTLTPNEDGTLEFTSGSNSTSATYTVTGTTFSSTVDFAPDPDSPYDFSLEINEDDSTMSGTITYADGRSYPITFTLQ